MTTNVGSTTTYFVGTHYEVTNGVITKYYYAGTQRIAMRKNGTLTYLFGDHLGSTSIVTDPSGALISETKYKAWGEIRYSSGSNPTDYTFTGQFSYTDDFGLMFYNARWYDPSLGRFAQADTIVPAKLQGLDRYAYVNNSPLNYIDPSGHFSEDAIEKYVKDYCKGKKGCYSDILNEWRADKDWWDMLLKAEAGDKLFGWLGNATWSVTFTGDGNESLTGIDTTNFAPGISEAYSEELESINLFDIQQHRKQRNDSNDSWLLNWVGIYRSKEDGKPDFLYIRPDYEYTDLGSQGNDQLTQNGIIVTSALGGFALCQPFGGIMVSATCSLGSAFAGVLVVDALDLEVTDHAYQVGPIYFNFQTNSASYTVTLEHMYLRSR